VGRQLVERAMKAAHGRFDAVRLRTNDAAAARLYEKLGFRRDVGRGDYGPPLHRSCASGRRRIGRGRPS